MAIEKEYANSLCRSSRDVVQQAQDAQIHGDYAVDSFTPTLLEAGTKVYRVCPNSTNLHSVHWYMSKKDVINSGFDYHSILGGAQISPAGENYKIAEYTVANNIVVAYGQALANTQFGPGGFFQYYITDFEEDLVFSAIYDLINIP